MMEIIYDFYYRRFLPFFPFFFFFPLFPLRPPPLLRAAAARTASVRRQVRIFLLRGDK